MRRTDHARARRGLGLTLAALLCLPAAGCLRKPGPAGITRLDFYQWGGPDDAALAQKMIDEFERENPDIKVDMTTINAGDLYGQKIQTLLIGGVVPDVMSLDLSSYYEWVDRGMLANVTDVMEGAARDQKMTFMPIVPEQLCYHGGYYAVPYMMCGVILQLNLDIFRKGGVPLPPVDGITWDWIARVAPELSRRSGHPDAPAEYFFGMPDMTSLLLSYGARIFDDDRHPRRVLVDNPEAAAMCRMVRRLSATKAVLSRAELTNSSNTVAVALFMLGRTAARIHGQFNRPGMLGIPAGFDWDVRPFPAGPGGQRVTADGAWALGMSPRAPHPEAARRFLRFYLSPAGIAINCRRGDIIPLFREMLRQPGIMPPNDPPSRQYYYDTLERGMCRFPVYGPGVGELRRIIDSRLEQVSAEPDVPIPVILRTLAGEIQAWLARERANGFYSDPL